ncbi:hypothetical protein HKX48_005083, partial [Thoreauomyces humboldtii]
MDAIEEGRGSESPVTGKTTALQREFSNKMTPAAKRDNTCRITIGVKMAIFAVLLTLASVGVMAIVSWETTSQLLSNQLTERMNTIALLRSLALQQTLSNTFSDLQLISSRVLIQGFLAQIKQGTTLTAAQVSTGTNDLLSAVASYKSLLYAEFSTADGQTPIFVTTPTDINATSIARLRYQGGGNVISEHIQNPIEIANGTFAWGLVAPVRSLATQELLGSIFMILTTVELKVILDDEAGLGSTGQLLLLTVVDESSYRFVIPPVRNPTYFGQTYPISSYRAMEIQAASPNSSGVVEANSFWGQSSMTAYQPVELVSLSEINQPVVRLRLLLLYAILSVLVAVLIVSLLAARLLVLPIRRLRTLALEFSSGDLDTRAPVGRGRFPDEILELNLAFNTMAAQLSSQYDSLDNKVKERTKALEAAKMEADDANAAKSAFLANITHELRTPLNGIIGLSALLAETPLNADQKDLIGSIRDCSDGLLVIINDVLDFSKIEAGKLELEKRPFDLFQCIENSLYLLHLKASQKGLLLSHKISKTAPKCIEGDITRLRQVLINLVGNSVKFTAEGEVVVTVQAVEHPAQKGVFELSFEVQDTGIGIPELVEMMGGRIWVTSEPGRGSKFCFTINAPAASAVTLRRPETEAVLNDLGQRFPMKILLAEDNAVNIKLAVRMLSRLGYEAVVVLNGAEAVREAKANPYDLILMDMQMPIMGGIEATTCIRSDKTIFMQPVIIALTANAMETDRQKCLDAGMDHHLSKPIKMDVLADALELWGAKIATHRMAQRSTQRLSGDSIRRIGSTKDGVALPRSSF